MSVYLTLVLSIVPAAFVLFVLLNIVRSDRRGVKAAAVSFPLCAVTGVLFAKVSYVLLMQDWETLFTPDPWEFCFTGGASGVCLGVRLAARITGYKPAGRLSDRFVLPGCLLAAGMRMAEIELGSLGTGHYMDVPSDAPHPVLAVYNQYGEAHLAVFVLEALAAVVVGLLSLRGPETRPGRRFETAVFRLCACQILLENMRNQSLTWGFVRVEQVLCAVILLALMLLACARGTKKQGAVRFLPALYLLLCIAAIVGIEFLRQRSPSRFMGEYGGFLMMGAVLCVVLLLYRSVITGLRFRCPPDTPEMNH